MRALLILASLSFLFGCASLKLGDKNDAFSGFETLSATEPGLVEEYESKIATLTLSEFEESDNYSDPDSIPRKDGTIGLFYKFSPRDFGECGDVEVPFYRYDWCETETYYFGLVFDNRTPHDPASRKLIKVRGSWEQELAINHTLSTRPLFETTGSAIVAGLVYRFFIQETLDDAIDDLEERADTWAEDTAPGLVLDGFEQEVRSRTGEKGGAVTFNRDKEGGGFNFTGSRDGQNFSVTVSPVPNE